MATLVVEQAAHGYILERLQGWNCHILSGVLLSCLACLLEKVFFLISCPLRQYVTVTFRPFTGHT